MAGQKETPRQKMIGLMYLVLMAMLALNIPKDILEAFVQVNDSLEVSANNTGLKNDQLYSSFEVSKQYDPVRVTEAFNKAISVRTESEQMVTYIEDIKKQLMAETEGVPMAVADTLQLANVNAKDNYDAPTHLMIGMSEDGSAGLSSELKQKIEVYRANLLGQLPESDRETTNIGLDLKGGVVDGQKMNWEMKTFYHATLAASIVNLTKLQNDIKNAEYDVVNKLYATVDKVDIPFDTVAPKVVAPTSYVLLGEEYSADVFLAAFSKTKDPKITINEQEIPVENGLGQYRFKTDREGAYTYNGMIEVETNTGEVKQFPFESNYIVARPSLTVSPTKMNVLYIGLTNPVSVSVPGVANENVSVSISGSGNRISRTGNGTYKVDLARNSPREVDVNVTATMQDGSTRSMGSSKFRVKRLPKPQFAALGRTTDDRVSRGQIVQLKVGKGIYPDFEFDITPELKGFKITIDKNGMESKDFDVTGRTIPANVRTILGSLKARDKVSFSYVKIEGPDGITHTVPGITLTVK